MCSACGTLCWVIAQASLNNATLGWFFKLPFSEVTWRDLILFSATASDFWPLHLEGHCWRLFYIPTTVVTTPSRSQQQQVFFVFPCFSVYLCSAVLHTEATSVWPWWLASERLGSHNRKCTRSYHENCIWSSIISWWKAADAVHQCNSNTQDENNILPATEKHTTGGVLDKSLFLANIRVCLFSFPLFNLSFPSRALLPHIYGISSRLSSGQSTGTWIFKTVREEKPIAH